MTLTRTSAFTCAVHAVLQVMGWRVLHGVNTVAVCEVWVVHLVAFGMGADVGNLIEVSGGGEGHKGSGEVREGGGCWGEGRGAPGGVRHGR